jgi:large subunit ribosomal protein L25
MTITKSLTASKREAGGKGAARKLRRTGRVPAVVYGKDMESVSISLDAMEVERLFQTISVENTIVELQIEGEGESHQTLVREIQSHPYRYELVHIDFLRIQSGVAVDVEVPVELIGIPVGVKQDGGVLEQIIHELPVVCLPALIPEVIEVDVSGLNIDDSLHLEDIQLPEGVVATIDLDRTICLVSAPRAAMEEEAEVEEGLEPGEAPEPEVVGEGGKEDED